MLIITTVVQSRTSGPKPTVICTLVTVVEVQLKMNWSPSSTREKGGIAERARGKRNWSVGHNIIIQWTPSNLVPLGTSQGVTIKGWPHVRGLVVH